MENVTRQRLLYATGDLLATSLAWFVFNIIRFFNVIIEAENHYPTLVDFLSVRPVWIGQIFFPVLMMGLYYLSGYYNKVFFKSRVEELTSTVATAAIGTIIIYFLAIVDDPIPDKASNYELLLMMFLLLFGFVYAVRLTITSITRRRVCRGLVTFNSLIIGTSRSAMSLRRKLGALKGPRAAAYNVVGYVATGHRKPDTAMDLPVYTIEELADVTRRLEIKHLIINSHRGGMQETLSVINRLFPLDLPILISPSLLQLITSKPKIRDIESELLIDISHANMAESTVNLKRMGDIVFSTLALIVLAPVYAAIAIAIKLDTPGPVFYSQERIGLRKKPFRIYKFRTMKADAEANGPALSSSHDNRITRTGHFLRKYRLDELPQFWNVLKGEMSLIGPRPEREFYIKQIIEKAPYYTLVHQVRPGITSLGMVKHGYASTVDEMVERLQYDIVYLENVSLTMDIKIVMYTISTVLHGRGV